MILYSILHKHEVLENQARKSRNESAAYYPVAIDNSGDFEGYALFTPNDISIAKNRAIKNIEDIENLQLPEEVKDCKPTTKFFFGILFGISMTVITYLIYNYFV